MSDWIPFSEGKYLIEKAFLVAPDETAVALENTYIEIYQDPRGNRQMKGRGLVRNILVVKILDDHDEIDLVLDLGEEFKYRLKSPGIQAGKVFSPTVKSLLQFTPSSPWEQIAQGEFRNLISRLKLLSV
jgi:hypothetical protein